MSKQHGTTFEIGDRVQGGRLGTEDHDTGRVTEIDGDNVTVAWDSGVTTTQHAAVLEHLADR